MDKDKAVTVVAANKDTEFRSFDIVRYHRLYWYICAVRPPNSNLNELWKSLYKIYQILFHVFISLYYPGSLIVALFGLRNVRAILENLAMNFTMGMCTVKLYYVWINLDGLERCKAISDKMDAKARANPEESAILFSLKSKVKVLMAPYLFLYTSVCITACIGMFLNTEKRLIYPAYFPFDWKANNLVYSVVMIYQYIGLVSQAYTNLVNDTFIPLAMCLLTYHLKVLSLRISRLGTDLKKSHRDNHEELVKAIKDHKEILE